MTEQEFWAILEETRDAAEGEDAFERADHQAALLTAALAALGPEAIRAFDRWFSQKLVASYRWGLWGAAYVINGGCSDDGFEYFRAWLIGQGRANFEAALVDPDGLAGVLDEGDEEVEGEQLLYAAYDAYRELTGRDLEGAPRDYGQQDMGEPWEEEELPERFPRLWARAAG